MFQDLEQVERFFKERRAFGIKPGLTRMYNLLESQSNPHLNFKAIHIAGTNGKGSTLTFIKNALQKNNYKVGVFTSPSLTGYTGHMLIDDKPIGEENFLRLLNQLLPAIQNLDVLDMHPTEFEIITTIAFMYFNEKIDIAIIEAGMGGREDTTNCIRPILSIITNIAMDHANYLGGSLEKIAYQKAGIIKQDVPTVVGKVDYPCFSIIEKEASNKNSIIYRLEKDFFYDEVSNIKDKQTFRWYHDKLRIPIEIKMKGMHQIENSSVALMALKILQDLAFPLDHENVLDSFRSSQLAGRFEKIYDKPEIILDGAHNSDGMAAFLNTVHNLFKHRRKHLVFAGFHDKDLTNMLKMALPYFDTVTVTTFDHPRAEKIENIIKNLSERISVASWKEKVDLILEQGELDEHYFFAGSLTFIGLIRDYITNN